MRVVSLKIVIGLLLISFLLGVSPISSTFNVYLQPFIWVVSLILLFCRFLRLLAVPPGRRIIYFVYAFGIKFALAGLMFFLVDEYYGGRDIYLYTVLPRELLSDTASVNYLDPTIITSILFAVHFAFSGTEFVWPILLTTAVASSVFSLTLLYRFSPSRDMLTSFFMLFLPSSVFFSCFLGKELFSFLCLTLIFLYYNSNQKRSLVFLSLLLLWMIRPYQGAIVSIAMLLTLSRIFVLRFSLGVLGCSLFLVFLCFSYSPLRDIVAAKQAYVYQGGQMMFAPPDGIFSILQLIRPFFWEHDIDYRVQFVSFDFIFLVFLFLKLLNDSLKSHDLPNSKSLYFLMIYSFLSMMVFSLNPNLGDLQRRKSYFVVPLVISLAWLLKSIAIRRRKLLVC